MKNKIRIIGFAGRARSGKTTLSKFLNSEFGSKTVTIASYLKNLCCELMNINKDTLFEYKDNNHSFEFYFGDREIGIINKKTGISVDILKSELENKVMHTVREMLQFIGTNIIRKYNPEWHVNQMKAEILSYGDDTIVTIDDVRFPNERKAIEEIGGVVLFVMRPSFDYVSNHISETSLQWYNFSKNHIIINHSNLYNLYGEFLDMMKDDFKNLTIRRKALEKNFENDNNLFGITYNDLYSLKPMLSDNWKNIVRIDNEHEYPMMVINLENCVALDRYDKNIYEYNEIESYIVEYKNYLIRENGLKFASMMRSIGIMNPYIIENMKLFF